MSSTIVITPRNSCAAATAQNARAPIRSLTIALTEVCNLDCWMCDFAVSKGLSKAIPLSCDGIVELIGHPVLKGLRGVNLTGGEPFAYPHLGELYAKLLEVRPKLHVTFSSNATLPKKMVSVLSQTREWNRVTLFTSIDGIEAHDKQRGTEGAFVRTRDTLLTLREHFPKLPIIVKFTITPVNFHEIAATHAEVTRHGFAFTVKLLENNPYYTNKLSFAEHGDDFSFSADAVTQIKAQLEGLASRSGSSRRDEELRDVLEALEHGWTRGGRCGTPTEGAFLDSHLNFFTCKEYPPVLNLANASLDGLMSAPGYSAVVQHEAENSGHCTRCTSHMKIRQEGPAWQKWLAHLRS
jgi:MoaA/NifB/PqqE/SkfB family radical SAM enzyme